MAIDADTKPLAEEVPAISEVDEAQEQADFDAGVAMEETGQKTKTPAKDGEQPSRDDSGRFVPKEEEKSAPKAGEKKPSGKAAPKGAAKPAEKPAVAVPEYVQITKDQFTKFEAAVARTEDFEKQFSKVFGTVGDMQKILRGLQSQTPRGAAVKLPPGAFAAMEKDFPELATHMKTAMEEILKGTEGTAAPGAAVDVTDFETKVEARVLKLAAEDLADEFPEWQKIVGAVDIAKGERPDPNNPFRKWLATKPKEYQDRINSTNSAGVITRAIRMFKSEEKKVVPPPAKPNKQAEVRTSRIAEAVRPKGDGGHPQGKSADDEFESGFKTG